MTSRSRSSSPRFSAWRRSPVRSTISRRNRSISGAAIRRKLGSKASPDSSCSLLINRVRGRPKGRPSRSKLRNSSKWPFSRTLEPSLPRAVEARDVVVHQLGGGDVVADDDEAGRYGKSRFLPKPERLLIMPVERVERGPKLGGQAGRIEEAAGLSASLSGHPGPDVFPELPVHRHFVAGHVVGHRHPRQLDDAALDGIHEREIAHRPGKESAFRVAGAAEEEGGGGKIEHPAHAERAVHRLQTRYPEPRRLPVLLGLLPLVALERFLVPFAPLFPVAVMGLVVQHQDVLEAHELGHHPPQHLALGFPGVGRGATALEERPASLRDLDALPAPEDVVVGDDDLRPVQVGQQVVRHEVAAAVVAVRVVRLQHPQPVPDGEAGGDDQESPREPAALRPAHRVDGLPGDQHVAITVVLPAPVASLRARRSSPGFASWPASSRYWRKRRPALPAWGATSASQMAVSTASIWQKKGRISVKRVMPPVPEQARGLRGHPPLLRVRAGGAIRRPRGGRC